MNRWSAWALGLAVAGALALRVPRLDSRPLHNDEAVNAVKVSDLWERGHYRYDPDEYHGPLLHYATLPFLWLSGARSSGDLTDSRLRIAPVFFGVGLLLLLPLFAGAIHRQALVWGAVFTAVSPAMVFYSRYFIHEMPLVFFTALTLGAGWRYLQNNSWKWAATTGAGLGLMFATKETFVLNLGAMSLASVLTGLWTIPKGSRLFWVKSRVKANHLAAAGTSAILIWSLFFSSFFDNPAGLADSILTYLPWLKRAGGQSPHLHPWSFYLQRLSWFHPARGPVSSEGLILILAALGGAVSFRTKASPFHRFLALYTFILMMIYCVIAYKTPWCLLGFLHGMILLAAMGAEFLTGVLRHRFWKASAVAILVAFTAQLTWQAWRASFVLVADRRNPYVYAQTVPDILKLVQRTVAMGQAAAEGFDTGVKVVAPESDYWPLPWYLRRFKNIGWYDKLPDDPFAPIIMVSSKLDARLDEKSGGKWVMIGLSELRPGKFLESSRTVTPLAMLMLVKLKIVSPAWWLGITAGSK